MSDYDLRVGSDWAINVSKPESPDNNNNNNSSSSVSDDKPNYNNKANSNYTKAISKGAKKGGGSRMTFNQCMDIMSQVLTTYHVHANDNNRCPPEVDETHDNIGTDVHTTHQGSPDLRAFDAAWSLLRGVMLERQSCNLVNQGLRLGSLCGGRNTFDARSWLAGNSCRVLSIYDGPAGVIPSRPREEQEHLHDGDIDVSRIVQCSPDLPSFDVALSLLRGIVMERKGWDLVNLGLGSLCDGRDSLAAGSCLPSDTCGSLSVYHAPRSFNNRRLRDKDENLHDGDTIGQGSSNLRAFDAAWRLLRGVMLERQSFNLVNRGLGSLCRGLNTFDARSWLAGNSCRVISVYDGPAGVITSRPREEQEHLHDGDIDVSPIVQCSPDLPSFDVALSLLRGIVMERKGWDLVNLGLGSLCGGRDSLAAGSCLPSDTCGSLSVYHAPRSFNNRRLRDKDGNLHDGDTIGQGSSNLRAFDAAWRLLRGVMLERQSCNLVNRGLGSLCRGRNTFDARSWLAGNSCRVLSVYDGPAGVITSRPREEQEHLHDGDIDVSPIVQCSSDLPSFDVALSLLRGIVMERKGWDLVNLGLGSLCGGRDSLAAGSCLPSDTCGSLSVYHAPRSFNNRRLRDKDENLHDGDTIGQGSSNFRAFDSAWRLLRGVMLERQSCNLVNRGLGSLCGGRNTFDARSWLAGNSCRVLSVYDGPAGVITSRPREEQEHLHDGDIDVSPIVQCSPDLPSFDVALSLLRGIVMERKGWDLVNLGLGSLCGGRDSLAVGSCLPSDTCGSLSVYHAPRSFNNRRLRDKDENLHDGDTIGQGSSNLRAFDAAWRLLRGVMLERQSWHLVNRGLGSLCGGRNTLDARSWLAGNSCRVLSVYDGPAGVITSRPREEQEHLHDGDIDVSPIVQCSPDLPSFDVAFSLLRGIVMERKGWDLVNLRLGSLCRGRDSLAAGSCLPSDTCGSLSVYHAPTSFNNRRLRDKDENLHDGDTIGQGSSNLRAFDPSWRLLRGVMLERQSCNLVNRGLGSLCGGRNTFDARSWLAGNSCRVLSVYDGPAGVITSRPCEEQEHLHDGDIDVSPIVQCSPDLPSFDVALSLLRGIVMERKGWDLVNLGLGSLCGGRDSLAAGSCLPSDTCGSLSVYHAPRSFYNRRLRDKDENLHDGDTIGQGSSNLRAFDSAWRLLRGVMLERQSCNLVNRGLGSLCGGRNTFDARSWLAGNSCRVLSVYDGPAGVITSRPREEQEHLHDGDIDVSPIFQCSPDLPFFDVALSLLRGIVMERKGCDLVNLGLGSLCGGRDSLAAGSCLPSDTGGSLSVYHAPTSFNNRRLRDNDENLHDGDTIGQGSSDLRALDAAWRLLRGVMLERQSCKLVNRGLGSLCGGRNTLDARSWRAGNSCRVLSVYDGPAGYITSRPHEEQEHLHDGDIDVSSIVQCSSDLPYFNVALSPPPGTVMERKGWDLINPGLGSFGLHQNDAFVGSRWSEENNDIVGECCSKIDFAWVTLHVRCLVFSAIVYVVSVGLYWIIFL